MKLDFDLLDATITEFGVGRDDGDKQVFSFVSVDGEVQVALREMSRATWATMQALATVPVSYEPSEKYSSCEHVYLPLTDHLAERMRDLHTANNLPTDGNALEKPSEVFCYFAQFTDGQNRRLTALRRATQFKGVLKSRLIRLVSDALKFVEEKVFKLDVDFDLLIDAHNLHILRPSGFEFVGELQQAVLAAVPKNIEAIKQDLKFVDFSIIAEYASQHPRAARCLASIRVQKETKNIDKGLLKKHCKRMGIEIKELKGKLVVEGDDVMRFLEVMDRRQYEVELVKGKPERFKAGSRSRLSGKGGEIQ